MQVTGTHIVFVALIGSALDVGEHATFMLIRRERSYQFSESIRRLISPSRRAQYQQHVLHLTLKLHENEPKTRRIKVISSIRSSPELQRAQCKSLLQGNQRYHHKTNSQQIRPLSPHDVYLVVIARNVQNKIENRQCCVRPRLCAKRQS